MDLLKLLFPIFFSEKKVSDEIDKKDLGYKNLDELEEYKETVHHQHELDKEKERFVRAQIFRDNLMRADKWTNKQKLLKKRHTNDIKLANKLESQIQNIF